jgi:hypothetical protein
MSEINLMMEPPFECPDDENGDAAFVKATRTIDGRDVMEEYMACGLFSLSVSFSLGEVADGVMHVLKLSPPVPDFRVTRLPKEANDGIRARVELDAVDVMGRYTHGEHKVCVEVVLNWGIVNQVFEHAVVPYDLA